MANPVIDLRRLKAALKGRVEPKRELPAPVEKELLETEEAAHPGGFKDLNPPARALLSWEAQEFHYDATSAQLLLLLGAALGLGGVIALFFANILFAIFLLIAGGLVASYAFRPPRYVRYALTPRGVAVGHRLYEFANLESFWIFYDPPVMKDLALRSKKTVMPVIRLPLGDLDPLQLREVLLRFLPEVEQEPSAVDVISKHLGF